MKKVMAIVLSFVMVMSMSITVFAKPGAFVSSPSGNPAPTLVEGKPQSDDCTGELIITPYSERDTLSEEIRAQFEKAYNEIVAATDLTKLNADLAALAAKLNIRSADLAVSDLFDITYIGCDVHEGHGYFDITLKADTLDRFVGLLHLDGDNWELVEDAKVETVNGEKHLTFSIDDFSPFAIVVNTDDGATPPQTGDNNMIALYVVVMAVSALALVIIWRLKKKQSA